MSKVMTVLAFAAGGAATYAVLKMNGGSDQLEGHIKASVDKARDVLPRDVKDDANAAKDKAKDTVNEASARVEAATS